MIIGLRSSMLKSLTIPPASSYQTSGLTLMYDGIENAGSGVHSAAADNWADLVGGYDLSLACGTKKWKSDCAEFWYSSSSDYSGNWVNTNFAQSVLGSSWTVEVIANSAGWGTRTFSALCGCQGDGQRGIEMFQCRNDDDKCYCGTEDSGKRVSANASTLPVNTKTLFAARTNGSKLEMIVGKTVVASTTCTATQVTPTISGWQIGVAYAGAKSGTWSKNCIFRGDIHCVRVYKGYRSDSDIASNYEIDKVRFGIHN